MHAPAAGSRDDPTTHPALSDSLRALARRGELRRFRRGAVLIHEGDIGQTVFIILAERGPPSRLISPT